MKPIRKNRRSAVHSEKSQPKTTAMHEGCFKDPHDYTCFQVKHTPKNKFACNGAAEKVSSFKTNHAPTASPKVYSPTPFTLLSPASTLGYGYDDEMSTTMDNNLTPGVLAGHQDPFDFDSELALIQDNELTDECTKAIAESLKEIQLELVARCLTPPVSFGDDAVESTATSAPVLTDNDDLTVSSSLYDAYSVLEGKTLTLKSMQSVPLDNDNMLVTLEMQDPVQLPGIDMSSPNGLPTHPALDLLLEKLSTSLEVVYGSATVKNNQVFIPEPLQGSVPVVQEDPIISGTDVSPVHEKVPVKTVTQPVPLKGNVRLYA